MIIGGNIGSGLTDTIELFNWKTKEQCNYPVKLPKVLSQLSGAVIGGVPVVCGGYGPGNTRSKECFKLDVDEDSWVPVSTSKRIVIQATLYFNWVLFAFRVISFYSKVIFVKSLLRDNLKCRDESN